MPLRTRLALFVGLATLVFAVDQVSKVVMTSWLAPRGSLAVLPGFFDLTYVRNTGAVFGLFRDLPAPWRGLALTAVPLLAIILVLRMALKSSRFLPLGALGLILGGAIGNLTDRLRLGSVVDFLDFYVGDHHWPAFNAADASICTGVGLLLLDMWLAPQADSGVHGGDLEPASPLPRPSGDH